MVQLTIAPVNNSNLFSKHVIENRIPEKDFWKSEEIQKKFEDIKALYEDEGDLLDKYNEPQLEKNFIRKVLNILGHQYEVQEKVERNQLKPDYGFFPSKKERKEAIKKKGSEDFYRKSIAIGDAKSFETKLDQRTRSGRVEYKRSNPSWQIYIYLKNTPARWGVLTNGRKWRLYNEETSDSLDTYYEVDLIQIIESGDLEKFKYFYFFFRQEAFLRDKSGRVFLDQVFEESIHYAKSVGGELEERVYKALEWMAKGYFSIGTNDLSKNEETLEKVRKNSLFFLYRLIFVLYAESNGLLGKRDQRLPKEYSINKLVEEVLEDIDEGAVESGGMYAFRLNQIFKLVDKGSEEVEIDAKVPAYNGGLFDNEKHPFLKNKKIGNQNLAKVIELLTRTETDDNKKARIDYSDLSFRNIGDIYEGLLEYNLKIAKEDMVAVKKGGTLIWESKEDTNRKNFYDEAEEGEIYLVTEEGERKATGSYYTPEYIVNHIIENTITPTLEEKLSNLPSDLEGEKEREAYRDKILSINVLDPAMGSGHFLVEATEHLAKELAPYLREEEVGEEQEDIQVAKRLVVKHCIYGVDINPLATELAKVSLWLNTISEDRPLSFLDHHLKTGNSLLGANIHDMGSHPHVSNSENNKGRDKGLKAYFDFENGYNIHKNLKEMLSKFKSIQEQRERVPKDIEEEEKLYKEFLEFPFRKRFEIIADVYLSYYFGNDYTEDQYNMLLEASKPKDQKNEDDISWNEVIRKDYVKKAADRISDSLDDNYSSQRSFFHWQLEFPEIFFDVKNGEKRKNPGFDIVVGNPPYVSNWSLTEADSELPNILEKLYPDVTTGHWDLFVPFVKRSMDLLRSGGRHSFVVPTSFAMEKYGRKIREKILKNTQLELLTEFGEYKAFGKEIDRLFMVYVLNMDKETSFDTKIYSYSAENGEGYEFRGKIQQDRFLTFPNNAMRTDVTQKDVELRKKIIEPSIKLGNICCVNVGVVAHSAEDSPKKFKKSDVIYEKDQDNFKKYLGGSEVSRYNIDWKGRYIDYESNKEHFHRPKFEELFEADKIIISRVSSEGGRISSCLDRKDFYTNDNLIHTTLWTQKILEKQKPKNEWSVSQEKEDYTIPYIAGLVNSSLLTYFFTKFYATDTLQGTYSGIYPEDVRNLPLLHLEGDEKEKISERVEKLLDLNNKINREVNSFLEWIEREWEVNIEDISRKTYLKKFWRYGFDENRKSILRIAKYNKSDLTPDPSSKKFQDNLKTTWEDSVTEVKSLLEKIRRLEDEIDAIVFSLYDLEIEDVEKVLSTLQISERRSERIKDLFRKRED